MRILLSLLVAALSACATTGSTARPYAPPASGPTASLLILPEGPGSNISIAVYDDASTVCNKPQHYMGYSKASTGTPVTLTVPAGRLIQLSPGYDRDQGRGGMCMDFQYASLTLEPGRQYRLRYEHERVPCEPDYDARPEDRRACQPWAPYRERCTALFERQQQGAWEPVPDLQRRPIYDENCPVAANS